MTEKKQRIKGTPNKTKRGKTTIVVGGQWGSEAKGLCVSSLALTDKYTHAVRTGSPNAGHTVYYNQVPYAMQTIPVAWVNPKVTLVLGAGAFIEIETLEREIEWIEKAEGQKMSPLRLFIDRNAFLLTHEMMEEEQKEKLHERMGSTGHGVGASLKARINRDGKNLFRNSDYAFQNNNVKFTIIDTSFLLNEALKKGNNVLVEGTQGTLLDFYQGEWPYVTSRSTISANWLAEAGLPPINVETVLVARTFPIRVAGNSGQLPQEINWVELAREVNKKLTMAGKSELIRESLLEKWAHTELNFMQSEIVPQKPITEWSTAEREKNSDFLSNVHRRIWNLMENNEKDELKRLFEFTTVTKKLRRIGRLDLDILTRAVEINGADWVWLNFLNYEFPEVWGCGTIPPSSKRAIKAYLNEIENKIKIPIKYVSTSPVHIIKVK